MNIRFLFSVCGFALSCLMSFSAYSACNVHASQYPNFDFAGGACNEPSPDDQLAGCFGGGELGGVVQNCIAAVNCVDTGLTIDANGNGRSCYTYTAYNPYTHQDGDWVKCNIVSSCANQPHTDLPNNPDYGTNPQNQSKEPTQECGTDGGLAFNIPQSDNCGNYCESPNTKYLEGLQQGFSVTPTIAAECGRANPVFETAAHSNGANWDCQYNEFMCSYDTNGDGVIDDNDNKSLWPDPTDGINIGSGCVTSDPSGCTILENHYNTDLNSDGSIGGNTITSPNSSANTGQTSSKYGSDFGGGAKGGSSTEIGGDNTGASGTGSAFDPTTGESIKVCDDMQDCESWAYRQFPNCQSGTRDSFHFFYESPLDFDGDCIACAGPTAQYFPECEKSLCPNGYDSQSDICWSESCPYGDCANPNDPSSRQDITLPNPPEEQLQDEKTTAAINDLLGFLKSNPPANSSDIQNQTAAIESAIGFLGESNTTGMGLLRAELVAIKNKPVGDVSLDMNPTIAAINETTEAVNQNTIATNVGNCLSRGFDGFDSVSGQCTGTGESAAILDNSSLDSFESTFKSSGMGSAMASFGSTQLAVSSECGGVMIQTFKLKLGNFVDTDLTINVCQWLEPVQDLLRLIALLVWGLVSLRVIFEA